MLLVSTRQSWCLNEGGGGNNNINNIFFTHKASLGDERPHQHLAHDVHQKGHHASHSRNAKQTHVLDVLQHSECTTGHQSHDHDGVWIAHIGAVGKDRERKVPTVMGEQNNGDKNDVKNGVKKSVKNGEKNG